MTIHISCEDININIYNINTLTEFQLKICVLVHMTLFREIALPMRKSKMVMSMMSSRRVPLS